MQQLTQILRDATAAVSQEYFLLPIHGADPVFRERVYCYELYHQMRLLWPGGPYRLNGEADKRAHPYFQMGRQPEPGDGFTVVSAMRHFHPNALTMLVSGYPDVQSAMAAIVLEADEIVVKPFEIERLTELVREKARNRKATKRLDKERVGVMLRRCVGSIVEGWLARARQSSDLNRVPLSDQERTGHLPTLVEDLALRLIGASLADL
jgi:hypothetical protein